MTRAVVMAAGEGSRLRPLTERWPKPVLPIDGRPVIATLLRELASAGVERAVVVTGHLAEQVETLVGDGGAFGVSVGFVRQPRGLGSADAVQRALDAGIEPPFLVTAADTVFEAGDVARFAAAAAAAAGAIAYRGRTPDRAPLWALGPALVPYLCLDEPPYELGNAFDAAIRDGVEIAAVAIGKTRDLTSPLDLVRENFPYLSSFEGS